MVLTEEEQTWATEHMTEDFTLGFTRKLRFLNGELLDYDVAIDTNEAESDGFFCTNCGGTNIDKLEEHVRECIKEEK